MVLPDSLDITEAAQCSERALDGDTRGQVSTISSVNNSRLFGQDLQSVKSHIPHLEYQGKPSIIFSPRF